MAKKARPFPEEVQELINESVEDLDSPKDLEELDLSESETLEYLDGLKSFKNLTELDLSECSALSDIKALSTLTKLEYLDLRYCESIEDIDILAKLKKLNHLDLSGCTKVKSFDKITSLGSLNFLYLNGCEQLQKADLFLKIKGLQELDIRGCIRLDVTSDSDEILKEDALNTYIQKVKDFYDPDKKPAGTQASSETLDRPAGSNCSVEALQQGDFLFASHHYQVTAVTENDVIVKTDQGKTFELKKDFVASEFFSAGQFFVEETLPRTDIINILIKAHSSVFTVNFNKQLKPKELREGILAELQAANHKECTDKALQSAVQKALREGLKGEERTLTGTLVQVDTDLGRSKVVDLAIAPDKHRLRLVDHRSINWLILRGVKYNVK